MPSIIVENQSFEYRILKKGTRSFRLRLLTQNSFQVSCPYLTPEFLIKKFIKDNSFWIINQSQKIITKKAILNLKNISILEKKYEIYWTKTQRDSVIINEDEQKIYSNLHLLTEVHTKKILESKLRPFALKLIKRELQNLSQEFGFKYNHITVRNQRSRYGSCSSRSNLNFNWQIIFFPFEKFRHILLHELTHLEHKNHSKIFWDQLTAYDPNCKKNNLWLKKEGTKCFLW